MIHKSLRTFVKTRYNPEVDWYDKKSIHNQKYAKIYTVIMITFSATTPILAALDISKWLTLASSFVVVVCIGILKYFKFEELWQEYRTICETLKKEKIMYETKIGAYETHSSPENLFVERVESMISRQNTSWLKTRKNKNQKESEDSDDNHA